MKFCWVLPQGEFQRIQEDAIQAERYNFESILHISLQSYLDPWIVATKLSSITKRIRMLIAQNPQFVSPPVALKSLNTINLLTDGRADINIVSGSSIVELSQVGKFQDHTTRYRRTREFVEAFRELQAGPATYQGEFFEANNCTVIPKGHPTIPSALFLSGSSDDAMLIAAQHADYYLVYADDLPSIQDQFARFKAHTRSFGREVSCGMVIDIIARKTSEEAWEAARCMLSSFAPLEKRLVRMYRNSADSVGISNQKKHYNYDQFVVDKNLWGGLCQISTAHTLSIVGSYEEVRDTMKRFHELGTEYFLLTGSVGDHEIERLGEYILPYLT
ncbi:LLM class flavin-dependent oxidoreductase [Brevibacillus antibioticus]|uniref:LLM class flavin-dependent oxidoreductase n=1 Tax=Brevibacillus antibioticus TaxID=2570228 RepID=A0A4U2Y3R4_9BACL|nr:LLM class flavin-dependent oxidoreductase [Brevibacillus antibioticus]TKI55088.1 LLM class flavin-dependent oxidoreductase [Brevibacillus antibioticus]